MNEIEEIKRKIDIVDLVSQYLVLKKSGANYKAPCPFHNEKTPSFMISADKQIYKCFGCGEGGDIFSFVMKMEGLEFVEALKMLADRAGIALASGKSKLDYQKEKDVKSRLYKINTLSAQVFHKILMESKEGENARKYLDKRGLKTKTINDFMLGFAPRRPILYDFLKKRGFSDAELKSAGNPQKFFQRIMFPISDVMGNVVAFTGRTIEAKIEPKYLNTPETPIFHKSRIVYALNKSKGEIKLQKGAVVVEGQMDVVLSHQAGVENVVATSGTALTAEHLHIIGRYTNNIVFAFDADQAGREAQKKAIQIAIMNDLNPKTLILPDGVKDPGEAVEKDPKLWQESVKKSFPAIDWIIEQSFASRQSISTNRDGLTGQEKKGIAKEILPIIKIIPDKIEKEHYVKILAKKLMVSERTIIEALDKVKTEKADDQEKESNKKLTLEECLIGYLLTYPEFLKLIVMDLDYKDFSPDTTAEKVYKSLQSCYTQDKCDKDFCVGKSCDKFLKRNISPEVLEEIKFLILQTEKNNEGSDREEAKHEIQELAKRIKEKKKDVLKENFARLIQNAEESGNRESVKTLLEEFQSAISKK